MGVWGTVEKTLGLPPLKEALQGLRHLAEGETGARLDRITARLVKLSTDSQGNAQAMELLRLVERLDQQGSLQRLDEVLRDLQPIVRSKGANALLQRLEGLAPLLDKLMKEG